jgi:hypothetical protein
MSGSWRTMKHKNGHEFRVLDTTTDQVVFIIEHQTRGLFVEFNHAAGSDKWGPRFRTSDKLSRRSPEIWSTRDPVAATEMIGRVIEHVRDAYVVRMSLRR